MNSISTRKLEKQGSPIYILDFSTWPGFKKEELAIDIYYSKGNEIDPSSEGFLSFVHDTSRHAPIIEKDSYWNPNGDFICHRKISFEIAGLPYPLWLGLVSVDQDKKKARIEIVFSSPLIYTDFNFYVSFAWEKF